MKGLEAYNQCSHATDMLAYLYNEMAAADRGTFEVHLADCNTCIDDFAELSQSRYPVYEWKCIQFDVLPTPRVVIPFSVTAHVSWFDQIRTTFSFRPSLAFGGAGIILAVVIGYFILGSTPGNSEVAREFEPSASPTKSGIVIPSPSMDGNFEASIESEAREAEPKAVKASTAPRPALRSANPKRVRQSRQVDPIPLMSSIEDDEDDSLRLADIFEEIGTSE